MQCSNIELSVHHLLVGNGSPRELWASKALTARPVIVSAVCDQTRGPGNFLAVSPPERDAVTCLIIRLDFKQTGYPYQRFVDLRLGVLQQTENNVFFDNR